MNLSEINTIENLLSYHSPKTPAATAKHEAVNNAAIAFANALIAVVEDPTQQAHLLGQIQLIRMQANAAVCYEREGLSVQKVVENLQASSIL